MSPELECVLKFESLIRYILKIGTQIRDLDKIKYSNWSLELEWVLKFETRIRLGTQCVTRFGFKMEI